MKLKDAVEYFSCDDFMLMPQHSTLKSRKEPDVSTKIGNEKYKIPVISSPMNTVTELEMIECMKDLGGCSVLHRYMSIKEQVETCLKLQCKLKAGNDPEWIIGYGPQPFYVAVGASGDYLERVSALWDVGIRNFCVDVANGHSDVCIDAVKEITSRFDGKCDPPGEIVRGSFNIMAGDVCSYEGAYYLANVGCTSIRVGIGPGSICKTRTITGHGVPQLSAIEDCARIKEKFPNVCIIADGGIRNSGDGVKCLAAGADALMVGGLLAGTEETPGQTLKDECGNLSKFYSGMASEEARMSHYKKEDSLFVPEGVSIKVPFKGSAKKIVETFVGGLKVGMSYSDARTLKELTENAEWVKITNNGMRESLPATKK